MKFTLYFFLLLCSCKSAQNVKEIQATHYSRIGGVRGSRAEVFEIKVTNHSKLKIKFLLIGKIAVPLTQKIEGENLILTGILFPEEATVQQTYEGEVTANLDFGNAHLVYEDLVTNQLSRLKIKFSSNEQTILPDGQLPE